MDDSGDDLQQAIANSLEHGEANALTTAIIMKCKPIDGLLNVMFWL